MRVSVIQLSEYLIKDKSYNNSNYKEEDGIQDYLSRIAVGIFKSDDKGKYDNTNDIIDDRGT